MKFKDTVCLCDTIGTVRERGSAGRSSQQTGGAENRRKSSNALYSQSITLSFKVLKTTVPNQDRVTLQIEIKQRWVREKAQCMKICKLNTIFSSHMVDGENKLLLALCPHHRCCGMHRYMLTLETCVSTQVCSIHLHTGTLRHLPSKIDIYNT